MYKYVLVLMVTFLLSACSFSVSFGDKDDSSLIEESVVNDVTSEIKADDKDSSSKMDDSDKENNKDSENLDEKATKKSNEAKSKVGDYAVYKKWAIQEPYDNEYAFSSFENLRDEDCIGMYNGETFGGDLLSNLILQDNLSPRVKLHSYTPEYVANLEQKVAAYTQETYDRNFYASYVCNYGDEQDLLVGVLWPQATKTCKDGICFGENADPAFIYVVGNNIYDLNGVRPYNQTATGAEVVACGAEDMDDYLLWECFMGFGPDNLVHYKSWDIYKDGTVSEPYEYTSEM